MLALLRASWLEANSYRVKMFLSMIGLLATAVPFYYVANALQTVMADSIATEGRQYFAFLIVGGVTFAFLRTSIATLPAEIGGAIGSGTLEALLGTPTKLWTLLLGLVSYAFTWTALRCVVFLTLAWVMGAHLLWSRALLAAGILALIIVVHFSFGIIAAAMILAFRASGPLEAGVIWISTILGGVYYPTQVIPSWLGWASTFVPLTYGLRALRRTLLDDTVSWDTLAPDVLMLSAMGAALLGVSLVMFSWSLRYARRAGTLAQY